MKTVQNSDLDWMAGILDKGCAITAWPNGNKYCIRLIISSTNAEIALRLHRLIRTGHIKIQKRTWAIRAHGRTRKSKIRDVTRYMLFGANAAAFLEEILPHLRTERAQKRAKAALRLHKHQSEFALAKVKALGTRTIQ
jgi:hypothetical protein